MSRAIADVWSGSSPERIVAGLGFTEGPTWLATEQALLFTDVPGNSIHRWTEADGSRIWLDNAHFAIGLTQDLDGSMLVCEQSTRRVTRIGMDGRLGEVLASSLAGRVLNAPNDIVVRSDGLVLFTDPPYGVRQEDGETVFYQVGMEQARSNVLAVTEDPQAPAIVTGEIWRPNGLCFSPDESIVYVTDTSSTTAEIYQLALDGDGRVTDLRVFATIPAGVPDGIKVDTDGRLYASGLDGVYVFATTGAVLGLIPCPEMVANCCFGGREGRTLFMTASSGVYRVDLLSQGAVVGKPRTAK